MRKSLFPFVPFLLLVVPVLEIAVFVLVGGQIGVINTLLGIVLTAFIGTILLRQQGFALIGQAQAQMDRGSIPGKELAHGVMLLAAGLLLLTPGFVTDSIGFLLLVPAIRDGIFSFFKQRMTLTGMQAGMQGQSAHFSSHGFGATRGTYYESHSYGTESRSSDSSIIDLDEQDFSEVEEREALDAPKEDNGASSDSSPWGKR